MNIDFFTRLFNKVVLGEWGTMYHVLRAISIVSHCYDELKNLKNNDGVVTADALINWAEPKLKNELFKNNNRLGALITSIFDVFEMVKTLLKKPEDEVENQTG